MATQTIENFNTLDLETLASVEGGRKVVSMGHGMYCYDGAPLKCWSNPSEIWSETGRVIVNGWVKYGPWSPRP